QPLHYSVSGFTDVGSLDTHTTLWQVKNGSNVVVATGSGLSLDFTPSVPGAYTISFRVTDDDSLSATVTQALSVSYANVQVDDCCPIDGRSLFVGGLTVNDAIQVTRIEPSGYIQVRIVDRVANTTIHQQQFAPPGGGFDRIVVYGQSANDEITIDGAITTPAFVHGGAGNDSIQGGGGNDVLLGDGGVDTVSGGGGRDLVIGGANSDVVGNATTDDGEDLLIAGTTAFDQLDSALGGISQEWSSPVRTYAQRLANVTGSSPSTPRANGNWFLKVDGPNRTVFGDSSTDMVAGGSGQDAFFANLAADDADTALDVIVDAVAGEQQFDTDSGS
ncbi:MAG TPA: hypothetical protein PLV92_28490, partial [Pirellulaceae bacterium]|nr:hypothetical protein [Pirellulaceae bacterium]